MPAAKTDVFSQVLYELVTTQGVQFDKSGLAMVRKIFNKTVGKFLKDAKKLNKGEDFWENPDFRKFIFGQLKRIAKAAKAKAGSAPVSGPVLDAAARAVMQKTEKICRTRLEKGKVKFELKTGGPGDGLLCSGFLGA